MYKLIAIYKMPSDIESFEKHYNEVHAPLAAKVPHLVELRINKIQGTPKGPSDLLMIAEMVFKNKDDFKLAMKSPENADAGKDLMSFAKEVVSIHFAEEIVSKPL